jgi:hypothetical protein
VQDFDRFDGLLITGSVYDAHGNNEWILKLLELLKALWIKGGRGPRAYGRGAGRRV